MNNIGNFDVALALVFIPKYGIRRNFSNHFNYKISGGIGYQYSTFGDAKSSISSYSSSTLDLQLRIGSIF